VPLGTAIAFTTDRRGWFTNSRRIVSVRTGRDGRYSIANLPAGEYRLVATNDLEQGEWFDPAVLERLLLSGTPIKITGADRITVDLQIK
jgi:hypothetical protein